MNKIKLNKKGLAFETINKGMISFIAFILIVVLVVVLVQVTKETDMICPVNFIDDTCFANCPTGFSLNDNGTTNLGCCNTTQYTSPSITNCTGENYTVLPVYGGSAYNATVNLQEAAGLPPQFAQIVVIVIIIVGILAMLTMIGYGAYQKMKK